MEWIQVFHFFLIQQDDAFSRIPYEKGCLFLLHLESLIGGKDKMVSWIQSYFNDNIEKSINTMDMKNHFVKNFPDVKIDWDSWLYGVGLPEWVPLDYLDQKLNNQCKALTDLWLNKEGQGASDKDIQWDSTQTMVFLDTLFNSGKSIDINVLNKMNSVYQFSKSKNVEILFRWFMLNLSNKNKEIFDAVSSFLAVNGRGVYLKPLYAKLNSLAKEGIFEMDQVKKVYQKNRNYYHSVIRNVFDNLFN
jgi:leukotriene-A4 hydrolase